MSGAKRYQLDNVIKQIEHLFKNSALIPNMYQSVENLSNIINAIVKTNGVEWASQLNVSEMDRSRFTEVFRPYISTILSFFGKEMKGGAEKTEDVKNENIKEGTGPDDITEKIMNAFQYIDSTVNQAASDYGIVKYENAYDTEPDIRLFPDIITKPIFTINPVISKGMEQIKVPFRMLVIAVYLFLDIARMSVASAGQDNNRRILSVVVALFDFLRGDWKKGILSIMGYFGTTPLFMGQLGKVYLTLFQTLSPTIQKNFIFGTIDSVKSIIIGVLLSVFKIAAPLEVRQPLIDVLATIAKNKKSIDDTLESADLEPLPDYMSPTFHDLNNLQALMDDPAFICSTEHEELVKTIDNSAIIHVILQLMRIPVTERFREYQCGKESKSFIERIVERQKKPIKIPEVNKVKTEKPEEVEKLEKTEEPEKTEKVEKSEEVEKTEKIEKPEEVEKTEEVEKPKETDKPEEPEKTEEKPEPPLPPTIQSQEEKPEPPLPPTISKGGQRKNRILRRSYSS